MLSTFTFSEPLCIHVPFELDQVQMKCEGYDEIIDKKDKIFVGILDENDSESNYICAIDNDDEE